MMNVENHHLVSVHIEKTAGTSVEDYLIGLFGAKKVLQYNPVSHSFIRNSDIYFNQTNVIVDFIKRRISKSRMRPLLLKLYEISISRFIVPEIIAIDDLPQTDYRVLHGHFVADQFADFVSDPLYAVLLRDPLSRMISHYVNWTRGHGNPLWRTQLEYDPKLSFEEFALLVELQNYQAQALGDMLLADFTFIGTTEKLNAYFANIHSGLQELKVLPPNHNPGVMKNLNKTPQKPIFALSPSFVAAFKRFHAEDYRLHEFAMGRE